MLFKPVRVLLLLNSKEQNLKNVGIVLAAIDFNIMETIMAINGDQRLVTLIIF